LLDGPAHHPAGRHFFRARHAAADHPGRLVGDATADVAGRLVGHAAADVAGVGLGLADRDALPERLVAGDGLGDRLPHVDRLRVRHHLALALHAGAGDLLGHLAADPHLDRLGRRGAAGVGARVAAVAAVVVAVAAEARQEAAAAAGVARHLTALPVALVHRLAGVRRHGDAGPVGLHARSRFLDADALAH